MRSKNLSKILFGLSPWIEVALGLILLIGRYEWSATVIPYSTRSYVVTALFWILFLPVVHFLLKDFTKLRGNAVWVTRSLVIIFCLPDVWLGLSRFRFAGGFFDWREPGLPLPQEIWFPKALFHLPDFPNEFLFFAGMLLLGFTVLKILPQTRSSWKIPFGIYVLILFETFLHMSVRSPYSYIPHHEAPASEKYWYLDYLFSNAQGAVNLDYPMYKAAEDLFIGKQTTLICLFLRLFPMFISTPFSRFINPYYVWLFLNLCVWSVGIFAIHRLTLSLFDRRVAIFASIFMASSLGLIHYVAQPKVYVFGIVGVIILLAIQDALFKDAQSRFNHIFLFGGCFALFLLCFDGQPWIIVLPVAAWVRGKENPSKTIIGVFIGFIIYKSYLAIFHKLPYLIEREPVATGGGHPVDNLLITLKHFEGSKILRLLLRDLQDFPSALFHAFNLATFLALIGIFWTKGRERLYLLVLFIPAFLIWSLMELGESFYTEFPRLVYSAYPAVFILAGVALATIEQRLQPKVFLRLGLTISLLLMLTNIVYANLDVFGFPQIYFHWFFRTRIFN